MKKILFAILSLMTVLSCVTDDTVTKFNDLNTVSISGLEDNYTFDFLRPKTIEPVVTTARNDESNLEYRWYLFNNTNKFSADTLSREKIFNAAVGALPGAGYSLVFSVQDKTTGVYYKKTMAATIVSDLTAGTLVLCEENGKVDLNFINPSRNEVLRNVFTNANPDLTLTSSAKRVVSANPNNTKLACKQIMVFSNDADGGFVLDPNTFKKTNTLRVGFYTAISDPILADANYETAVNPKTSSYDYLFINGKVYNRSVGTNDPKWKPSLIITDTSIPTNYSLAPFAVNTNLFHANSSQIPVFYDNLNGRFLNLTATNVGYIGQFPFVANIGFEVNNTGMKILGVGDTNPSTAIFAGRSYIAICESIADPSKRYLMRFSYGFKVQADIPTKQTLVGESLTLLDPATYPGIYATDKFVYEYWNTTKGILWYTDGGKLYALNAATASAPTENVMINFAAQGLTADVVKTFNRSTLGKSLIRIAVRDNNLSTGKAGIINYEASLVGGITIDETSRIFGLGDKIIDFDEKVN